MKTCVHTKPTHECYNSLIYGSKVLEITPNSFSGRMAKQILVHPYTAMLLCNKKEIELSIHATPSLCLVKKVNL